MKKLSLILLLVLALSVGLTACNQASATPVVARWYDGEHYEFNISKADLSSDGEGGYAKEYTVRGEANPEQMDEKVPENLRGKFVMDIKLGEDENKKKICTYTTSMELVSLYKQDYFDSLSAEVKTAVKDLVLSDAAMKETFGDEANGVAIKSTTTTSVTFHNDISQRPVRSEKTYDGYYFGATHQEASKSTVVVDYANLDKNKVSVKIDGAEAVEKDISYNKNANIIDANQILLYIRSLEKTANSFQDGPNVQVYDPVYNVVRKASFSMTYTCQTFIEYTHDETTGEGADAVTQSVTTDLKAKLTCVAAVIDGQVFMVQMNLPALTDKDNKDKKLDYVIGEDYCKYTTVRFRSGYKTFEIADYDALQNSNGEKVGASIVEALKAAVA